MIEKISCLFAELHNFMRKARQWQHAIRATQFDSLRRHAENDAGCFVLSKIKSSSLLHLKHASRSIITHASHDDTDDVTAAVASSRAEQHVDRGTMPTDQWSILDLDIIASATALEQCVSIAGRNQCLPTNHRVIILGLFDRNVADAIEAFGKTGGKDLRHVLNNDNAWRIKRHGAEKLMQSFGPSR